MLGLQGRHLRSFAPSHGEFEHSGRGPDLDGFHEIQNHVNDGLIADRRIDHGVIDGAVWPFDFEIFLDEIGTLAVDAIHELLGFRLALASRQEAPDFVFSRSVKKHTQGVWTAPQKKLRPPSDDDRVSSFSGVLNDAFCNLQNTFAVNDVELVRVEAAFITSAQKGFEEPVVERIGAFLSNLDDGFGAIREPGNLLGQQLIPKLPAQLRRKQLSDFASAASILPFNCDDFDHAGPNASYSLHAMLITYHSTSPTLPPLSRRHRDHSSSKQSSGRT